jgi:hypothetical protein
MRLDESVERGIDRGFDHEPSPLPICVRATTSRLR